MKKVLRITGMVVLVTAGAFMLAALLSPVTLGDAVTDVLESQPDMYVHIDDSMNYLSSLPVFYETGSGRVCILQDEHPVYIRDEQGGYFYYLGNDIVTENEIQARQ